MQHEINESLEKTKPTSIEKNMISMKKRKGILFKASGGALKIIRGSIVLMKERSKRNLYVLQFGGGFIGHKFDEEKFESPGTVAFGDEEKFWS